MSDLIQKSELIEEVQKYFVNNSIHKNDLAEVIAKLPTVEAKPVVHGEWLRKNVQKSWGKSTNLICSICGEKCWLEYDFCPNCGADMRGGNNE